MAKKPTVTDLKKYLNAKTGRELADEIVQLYSKLPQVKEHYAIVLSNGDDSEVVQKYKKIIKTEFVPGFKKQFPDARLSIGRKAVLDYKKIAATTASLADLMLVYVESGILYTNAFGDIDMPFYNSMESMYDNALKVIAKEKLFEMFNVRLLAVINDTRHIGWGFPGTLEDIYLNYTGNQ